MTIVTTYKIAKELKATITKLKKAKHPNPKNKGQELINKKYGKGWRGKFKKPTIIDDPRKKVFDMIYGDLSDGAYFAAAEEFGIDLY